MIRMLGEFVDRPRKKNQESLFHLMRGALFPPSGTERRVWKKREITQMRKDGKEKEAGPQIRRPHGAIKSPSSGSSKTALSIIHRFAQISYGGSRRWQSAES
jgi:hypothetical protein